MDADGEFTTSLAATIPYADEWNALPPFQTLERLPREGIVIWLGLSRTNRFPLPKPARKTPFQLEDFGRVDLWEGQIRDLPEYRLWRRQLEELGGTPITWDEIEAWKEGTVGWAGVRGSIARTAFRCGSRVRTSERSRRAC